MIGLEEISVVGIPIEYSKCLYKPYWNNGVLYLPIGWKDEVEKKIRKECSNGD